MEKVHRSLGSFKGFKPKKYEKSLNGRESFRFDSYTLANDFFQRKVVNEKKGLIWCRFNLQF